MGCLWQYSKDALRQFALAKLIEAIVYVVVNAGHPSESAVELCILCLLLQAFLTQPKSLNLCYCILVYILIVFVFEVRES